MMFSSMHCSTFASRKTITMRISSFLLIAAALAFTACEQPPKTETSMEIPLPPVAPVEVHEHQMHGDVRVDPYYWMMLTDEQKDKGAAEPQTARVLDYLNAENAYTEAVMKSTEGLQEELYEEIVGRIDPTDQSVPYLFNGYYYYTRYEEGKEYPFHCRKKGNLEADEEIMLNVPEMAEGFSYYAIGGRSVSPNNKLLVYGEDTLSRRIYTLRFKDLETGEALPDIIPGTVGSATWANDNETVFYAVRDEALRSYKIFRHKLGTPVSEDEEIYHEKDETFNCYIGKTKSQKYLVIASRASVTAEYHVLEADNPEGKWRTIQPRERGLEYDIDHYEDHFYIRTNWDAENFRLMRTPLNKTTKENWKEVVAHRDDALLEGMAIFNKHLVLEERIDGLTKIRVMPWSGEGEHYIDFPDAAYASWLDVNMEFDTEVVRVGYTSMVTPSSVYDYNMETRERELLKQAKVIGGYDADEYHAERLWVTARDGEKVPVSLVYRKDKFKQNGTAPLLLYGYGSYGNSMDPYFSSVRLSLLDRGFVFAIAHIRGGEEMGRRWYNDGKMLNKMNTFTDFIDCGEFLIQEKYAAPDHLYAMGGSAGGLLMGAVMNLRPDLWAGIVAQVPFVDVVTTMLDESIPLTTGEYDEWGNPNDEEYYHYMKSYSPYDNIAEVEFPHILVTTGYWDSQVQYWEPAKWVALLRTRNTGDNLILLKTNMDAGHGGASGRYQRFREVALEYAFLLKIAGKAE